MGHFGGKYLVENLAEIVVFVYVFVFLYVFVLVFFRFSDLEHCCPYIYWLKMA